MTFAQSIDINITRENLSLKVMHKSLTLSYTTSQNNCFFYSDSYHIEVMITSPIEILALQNFGHDTASAI